MAGVLSKYTFTLYNLSQDLYREYVPYRDIQCIPYTAVYEIGTITNKVVVVSYINDATYRYMYISIYTYTFVCIYRLSGSKF